LHKNKQPHDTNTCLNLKNLSVRIKHNDESINILQDVSITIEQGQTTGLIGASGCGKTLTALAILHLLPENFVYQLDELVFENTRLPEPEKDIQNLRGKKISMIFQDAVGALNPVINVGRQMSDVITTHQNQSYSQAKMSVLSHLKEVEFNDPERIFKSYPHQLSGGMAQRVMIAMALSCQPSLIIADEPTTSLDLITQKQVLNLLCKLQAQKKFSLLLISHDINVISLLASQIYVMKSGRILDHGSKDRLLNHSSNSYVQSLIHALPEH